MSPPRVGARGPLPDSHGASPPFMTFSSSCVCPQTPDLFRRDNTVDEVNLHLHSDSRAVQGQRCRTSRGHDLPPETAAVGPKVAAEVTHLLREGSPASSHGPRCSHPCPTLCRGRQAPRHWLTPNTATCHGPHRPVLLQP